MSRIETVEIRPTPLETQRDALPVRNRAAFQCDQIIAAAAGIPQGRVTVGQWQMLWETAPIQETDGSNVWVKHLVSASLNGTLVFRDYIRQINRPPMLRRNPLRFRTVQGPNGRSVQIDNAEDDPLGATIDDILHTIRAITREGTKPLLPQTPGTVDTFYSATGDGYLHQAASATWAIACLGGSLTTDTSNVLLSVDSFASGGPTYEIYEAFAAWDTSAIPDTDTVSDAVLSLWSTGHGGTGTVRAYAVTFGTLTSADWQNTAALLAATELATFAYAGVTDAAYNTFTNTGGALVAAINKTGTTEMCLAEARLEDNSTPGTGTDNYIDWSSADQSGTSQDPKLVVTHAAAGGGFFALGCANPGVLGCGVGFG